MIYLGSDHGGFDLKEKIKKWLTAWDIAWEDLGNTVYESEDDYPNFAFLVAQKVAKSEKEGKVYPVPWAKRDRGILACRSAAGMVIAANKIEGARCSLSFDVRSAQHCRLHNDANILALSGDWLEEYQAQKILKTWLETEFSGEARHIRRLQLISKFESSGK